MLNRLFAIWLVAALGFSSAAPSETAIDGRTVLGWVEWITIKPWAFKVKARLDTGASTASMHAEDIMRLVRNGKDWVRFTLNLMDFSTDDEHAVDRNAEVELPVQRVALIKQHDGSLDRRPVVIMTYCLDGQRYKAEFSLKNRSQLNYPVLLGRRALMDIALVDPAQTFLADRGCPAG